MRVERNERVRQRVEEGYWSERRVAEASQGDTLGDQLMVAIAVADRCGDRGAERMA